ncbi:YceD family protein [Mycolicibacter arupensis]|uniref:YceD family protein n=1 Tax=Mycolicibacter arupensis TaxID=342002 RepID=UPI0009E3B018
MARHPGAGMKAARRKLPAPFVINVSRLGRRPGALMPVREQRINPDRIGLDLVAIPADAAVELDLRVESVSEGVLVTGMVWAPTAGECARCLQPVTGDIEVELTELFAYPDSTTDATTDEDDMGRVVDDAVDLEQAIVDAVGLALPLSPLCDPDCPGLCPDCGVVLAAAEPGHHHDKIDPRWAKLAGMVPAQEDSGRSDDGER